MDITTEACKMPARERYHFHRLWDRQDFLDGPCYVSARQDMVMGSDYITRGKYQDNES